MQSPALVENFDQIYQQSGGDLEYYRQIENLTNPAGDFMDVDEDPNMVDVPLDDYTDDVPDLPAVVLMDGDLELPDQPPVIEEQPRPRSPEPAPETTESSDNDLTEESSSDSPATPRVTRSQSRRGLGEVTGAVRVRLSRTVHRGGSVRILAEVIENSVCKLPEKVRFNRISGFDREKFTISYHHGNGWHRVKVIRGKLAEVIETEQFGFIYNNNTHALISDHTDSTIKLRLR